MIAGRPNVGKSSLLNRLTVRIVIVTDIAGTTRDTIDSLISLDGVPVRSPLIQQVCAQRLTVERIGIERAEALFSQRILLSDSHRTGCRAS